MSTPQPKIFLLGSDGRGWSIDQDRANTEARLREAGFAITRNLLSATHIWCVWLDILMRPRFKWVLIVRKLLGKKLIGAVTNDITEKPEKLSFLKEHLDVCIAPSKKVEQFLLQNGINTIRIPFHIQIDGYAKLERSKKTIAQELGIDPASIQGKVLIGSFQRDSLGTDLTKQKWQKNPELLVQIAKLLPRNRFALLLAGPRRHYLINRCKKENIPYVYVGDESFVINGSDDYPTNVQTPEIMNLLYNLSDIYIVCSKSEGGPKAVLEGALAETLVISTDVGLAPDILDSRLIYSVDDPGSGAKIVLAFMQDPSVFLSVIQQNLNRVKNEFDSKNLKTKFLQILSV